MSIRDRMAQLDKRTPVTVEITVTSKCNKRCKYCFENTGLDKSSPEEEARQIELIGRYCDSWDRTKHSVLRIVFWGGEPMMNTDFLYRIIERTYRYDFVRYMMYSNGTLTSAFSDMLSQKFIDSIRNRMEIQLSYDGEPHNSIKRGYGPEQVMEVADMLLKNGIQPLFKATLSFDMLDKLPQIWESYRNLWKRYSFVYYSPTLDQTSQWNTDEAFINWKKSLVSIAKKERRFMVENGRPLWSWFNSPRKMSCNVNNTIHMHCDGNMYVCHGCESQECREKFVVGKTSACEDLETCLLTGFNPYNRDMRCIRCQAVICLMCHVDEIAKSGENASNYRDLWNKVIVNNIDRCRYFRYFGMIYHALILSLARL